MFGLFVMLLYVFDDFLYLFIIMFVPYADRIIDTTCVFEIVNDFVCV